MRAAAATRLSACCFACGVCLVCRKAALYSITWFCRRWGVMLVSVVPARARPCPPMRVPLSR